jgi:hypothetical protein
MEQRKSSTLFVLALEIAAIAVLHTVKIFQSEKAVNNKETTRNISSAQQDSKMKSSYSLSSFKN